MNWLRFELRIVDANGEEIVTDFTSFPAEGINEFGMCEQVDIHVGAALRAVKRDFERQSMEPV